MYETHYSKHGALIAMKHVLIDTDPGIDDALALLLAFASRELKVEAVTTVVGNVNCALATRNALQLLEFLGVSDVPVAPGAVKPLLRPAQDSTAFHGPTGLGEAILPEPKLPPDSRSAVQLILELGMRWEQELTLIALGPLTNIATAILVNPQIVDKIGTLVHMGGAFHLTPYGHGNMNAVAEFNIWHDPEAAKIVYDSGIPMTAVGLDVTNNPANRLSREKFQEIEQLDTQNARLVTDLCKNWIQRFNGMSLHDPLAVAAVVDPSLVQTKKYQVKVEIVSSLTRGQTVVERRSNCQVGESGANVDICVAVESHQFQRMFMERIIYR